MTYKEKRDELLTYLAAHGWEGLIQYAKITGKESGWYVMTDGRAWLRKYEGDK